MATLFGGEGNDKLTGTSGDDLIVSLMGDDSVTGLAGNDSIYGGMGADTLLGDQGNDLVLGNRGNDVLYGGKGNDSLYGGKGNDLLIGGLGDDFISGDQGDDTASFAGTRASYTITRNDAGNFIIAGPDGTDTVSTVEHFQFSDGTVDAAYLIQGTGGGGTTPAPPAPPTISTPTAITEYEKFLPTGTRAGQGPTTQSGSFTIGAEAGVDHIAVRGTNITLGQLETSSQQSPIAVSTGENYDTLSITGYQPGADGGEYGGVVSFQYTLTGADVNGSTANAQEVFPISVTDINGFNASSALNVSIIHDTPIAFNDYNYVNTGIGTTTGNVITSDGESDNGASKYRPPGRDTPGADGPIKVDQISHAGTTETLNGSTATSIAGSYGNLNISPDGSYTYATFNAQETRGPDTFSYRISDQNGNSSGALLTINIFNAL